MNNTELAQVLYEAYGDKANWKTYNNTTMDTWLDVREDIKDKWVAVAVKAREVLNYFNEDISNLLSYNIYLAKYFNKTLEDFVNDFHNAFPEDHVLTTPVNYLLLESTEKTCKLLAVITEEDKTDEYPTCNGMYHDSTLNVMLKYYNKQLTKDEVLAVYKNYLPFDD